MTTEIIIISLAIIPRPIIFLLQQPGFIITLLMPCLKQGHFELYLKSNTCTSNLINSI